MYAKASLLLTASMVLFVGFLLSKSPIDAQTWTMPHDTQLSSLRMQAPLEDANITFIPIPEALGRGPEDITLGQDGYLYTGLDSGIIARYEPTTQVWTEFVNTNGRPLGLRFDTDANLIVADAERGLLLITPDKNINILADSYAGQPLKFVDHLVISKQGDIYFSDASIRFGMNDYVHDFLEASQTGRIFKLSQSGELSLIAEQLFFANGVTLTSDESKLLINETGKSRVLSVDLSLENRAYQTDVWLNLPGMPDNIFTDQQGDIWISIIHLRDPLLEGLSNSPLIRNMLGGLPRSWFSGRVAESLIVKASDMGKVETIWRIKDTYQGATSALAIEDNVYLGSLSHGGIGRFTQKKNAPFE